MNRLLPLVSGFIRMVRWPNLAFIALTQLLFQFCIYQPIYAAPISASDTNQFLFLLAGSIFIAAGGYTINDYFDENIDEVNRPLSRVVGKVIGRRWAIAWHGMLSLAGLYCTWRSLSSLEQSYLLGLNFCAVLLLWVYSTKFKKSLLLGNVMIALLVSWALLVVFFSKLELSQIIGAKDPNQLRFFKFTILYAGFAFLITMARELVKDAEDMAGDRRFGCRTLPIVWGLPVAKLFTALWLLLLTVILGIVSLYLLQLGKHLTFLYVFFLVFIPHIYLLFQLKKAASSADFGRISHLIKWIQLAGILSMLFFYQ